MQTWLDWYIKGCADTIRQALGKKSDMDDLEAARMMCLADLDQYRRSKGSGREKDQDAARLAFMSALMPFLVAGLEPDAEGLHRIPPELRGELADSITEGRGIRPSSDLVQAMLGAKPGDEVRRSAEEVIRACTWYIDLPHRALLVSDETQIRAIFVQPSRRGTAMLVAILTAPGSNQMTGRYAWMYGAHTEDRVYGLSLGADPELVCKTVEDFVNLLLAYREFASDIVQEPVPRYTTQALRALPAKRRKALRNKATLFQITDLKPPEGRFGKRREEDVGQGWKLDHVVQVRGHFRWQPHGPQRKLRKLIWIAPHERGRGSERPVMERIE